MDQKKSIFKIYYYFWDVLWNDLLEVLIFEIEKKFDHKSSSQKSYGKCQRRF